MRFPKVVLGVVGSVFLVGAVSVERSTVERLALDHEEVCGQFFVEGCPEGFHKLQGPSQNGWSNLHGDCAVCISGECHPYCGPEEEDAQEAYSVAMTSLQVGDVQGLLGLAETIPRYVFVNEERQSVQVLDCQAEKVIGNLRLGTSD